MLPRKFSSFHTSPYVARESSSAFYCLSPAHRWPVPQPSYWKALIIIHSHHSPCKLWNTWGVIPSRTFPSFSISSQCNTYEKHLCLCSTTICQGVSVIYLLPVIHHILEFVPRKLPNINSFILGSSGKRFWGFHSCLLEFYWVTTLDWAEGEVELRGSCTSGLHCSYREL